MRSQARAKVGKKNGNPAYRTPSRRLAMEYAKHKGIAPKKSQDKNFIFRRH